MSDLHTTTENYEAVIVQITIVSANTTRERFPIIPAAETFHFSQKSERLNQYLTPASFENILREHSLIAINIEPTTHIV